MNIIILCIQIKYFNQNLSYIIKQNILKNTIDLQLSYLYINLIKISIFFSCYCTCIPTMFSAHQVLINKQINELL